MLKEVGVFVLLIITFLGAAKTHGRQHRLERELRGYWNVSFTSRSHNPQWVKKFWYRQRIVYWTVALIPAIVLISCRPRARKFGWKLYAVQKDGALAWILFLILAVGISMIVAFLATGLWSVGRLAVAIQKIQAPGYGWMQEAIWGSVRWWLFTATMILIQVVAARVWLFERPGSMPYS